MKAQRAAHSFVPFFGLIVAAAVGAASPAFAGQATLIAEIERLRNTLAPRDPSRPELSLRLADLYFYEGADLAKQADLTPENPQASTWRSQATAARQKSLSLYREQAQSLPVGDRRWKAQFQMARLTQELGLRAESKALWKELAAQNTARALRNEAVLRLGEMSEEENTSSSLKDAETYYSQAVQECQAGDLCPYIRFRLAWLLRHQGRLDAAISSMQASLWDSHGKVREDSLRDLIAFFSAQTTDGEAALAEIEALSARLSRPELIGQLAGGFFSNGNKPAGVRVLEFADARSPSFAQKVRLLEELYGLRRWDRFRAVLGEVVALPSEARLAIPADELDRAEKTIRRLGVQLDGERISDSSHLADFQGIAQLYLQYFSAFPDRFKMMEGWLASEPDGARKEAQILTWVNDSRLSLSNEQLIRLREIRIVSAQKTKNLPVVAEEAAALAALVPTEAKKREYRYARARALYELNQYDLALEEFRTLAVPVAAPDSWAVLSQNLALDILAAKKDLQAFMTQADLWLTRSELRDVPGLAAELADMARAKDEAIFEAAVRAGSDPAALKTFISFCREGKFVEKACANGKVLAVALGDSDALIELLRREKNTAAVANELEAAGRFAEAAAALEEQTPLAAGKWAPEAAIKIALMYELGEKTADQKRWLMAWVASAHRLKKVLPSEALAYQTLFDAGMIEASLLSLSWSVGRAQTIAHELELQGRGNAQTQKILFDSKTSLGKAWAALIVARAASLDVAQKKISFYGKNSRNRFQARVAALQALDRFVVNYLEGADVETRVALLGNIRAAYEGFANEIVQTPLPAGLDEASIAQLKASLEEMAGPFRSQGSNYARLEAEQVAKGAADVISITQASPAADPAPLLRARPRAAAELAQLQNIYASRGQLRLASYFEGRVQHLKEKQP